MSLRWRAVIIQPLQDIAIANIVWYIFAITRGRRETLYCAIVRAVTVSGGVPKQRVGAQRIVLIRAQRPRHKTISCIGQVMMWSRGPRGVKG